MQVSWGELEGVRPVVGGSRVVNVWVGGISMWMQWDTGGEWASVSR